MTRFGRRSSRWRPGGNQTDLPPQVPTPAAGGHLERWEGYPLGWVGVARQRLRPAQPPWRPPSAAGRGGGHCRPPGHNNAAYDVPGRRLGPSRRSAVQGIPGGILAPEGAPRTLPHRLPRAFLLSACRQEQDGGSGQPVSFVHVYCTVHMPLRERYMIKQEHRRLGSMDGRKFCILTHPASAGRPPRKLLARLPPRKGWRRRRGNRLGGSPVALVAEQWHLPRMCRRQC